MKEIHLIKTDRLGHVARHSSCTICGRALWRLRASGTLTIDTELFAGKQGLCRRIQYFFALQQRHYAKKVKKEDKDDPNANLSFMERVLQKAKADKAL